MTIEIGKTYKVYMGGIVKIEYMYDKCYTGKPFKGNIVNEIDPKLPFDKNHISLCFFSLDGKYDLFSAHKYNIEKEWKEEESFQIWKTENFTGKDDYYIPVLRNIYDSIDMEDKLK